MTPPAVCRGRVLIIGQREVLYEQLNKHFDLCRLEVLSCATSTRALLHLWGQPWDVVVTDPSSSTSQCLALARAVTWLRPDVRLIALSPTATVEDIIAAIRAHVFAYFSAPFDTAEIIGVLHTALGASDWQQSSSARSLAATRPYSRGDGQETLEGSRPSLDRVIAPYESRYVVRTAP